jgi:hypothetical protein
MPLPFAVNCTVPVGAGEFTGVTVAVNVTVWPKIDGFTLELKAKVVVVPDPTSQGEAADGMPFPTTYNSHGPLGMPAGTSKLVDTIVEPVATPMVLWP